VGDSYALIALAVLTRAAVSNLLPRPRHRGVATAGTVAALNDQELSPAPSEKHDGASVPAPT